MREDREFFFTGMHFTHDSLNPQSIYARFLCALCLCVFVLEDVTGLPDADFLARLNTLYDTMLNNPSCFNPPVNMPGLKDTIDAYAAAVSAAAQGGPVVMTVRESPISETRAATWKLVTYFQDGFQTDGVRVQLFWRVQIVVSCLLSKLAHRALAEARAPQRG